MSNFADLVALDVELLGLNKSTYAGSERFLGVRRCKVCFNAYDTKSWSYTGKSGQEVTVCERCHQKAQRMPA